MDASGLSGPSLAGQPGRLPGIEVLRGIAAVAVILSHVARHLDKWHGAPALVALFQPGHAGVDLFFVVSGFVIFHAHRADVGRPSQLSRYLARRWTRIYPPYWIVLALTVVGAAGHGLPDLSRLLWSAALLPSRHEPLLGIAWTLQFEVAFYAAFALLILDRRAGLIALGAWGAMIAAGATGVLAPGRVPIVADVFGLDFLAGVAAAALVRAGRVSRPGVLAATGTLLAAGLLALEGSGLLDGFSPLARLGYGASFGLLVAGVAGCDRTRPIRYPALARRLGAASYSLYLWQFVFIGVAWKTMLLAGLDRRVGDGALFVLLATAAVSGGMVANRLVERPLLRLTQRPRRSALAPATLDAAMPA